MSFGRAVKAIKNMTKVALDEHPDTEPGEITAVNSDGTFSISVKGRAAMPSVPNVTTFEGPPVVGDPVIVGYVERKRDLPFIVHRAPKINTNTTRFASWPHKYGYRKADKASSFFDYEAFDLQNTKFDGYNAMTTPPSIDVVDKSVGYYANGATLYRLDLTTSPISVIDNILTIATIVGVGEAYLYTTELDGATLYLQARDKGDLSVKFSADVTDAHPYAEYWFDAYYGTFCAEGSKVSWLYLKDVGGEIRAFVRIYSADLSEYIELDPEINCHLGLDPSEMWAPTTEYGFYASGNPTPDPLPWSVAAAFPQVLTTEHDIFVCAAFNHQNFSSTATRQPYGAVITCINRDTGEIRWKIEGPYGMIQLQWLKDIYGAPSYDVWTPPIPDPPVAGTYNLKHYYYTIERNHDYGTRWVFTDYEAYRLICATSAYLFVEKLTVTQATGLQEYVYSEDFAEGYTEDHVYDGSSWTIGPRTDLLTDLNDSAPYSLRYLVETKLIAINIAYGSVGHGTIASEGNLPASASTWNFTGPSLDIDGSQPNCNLNTEGFNPQVDYCNEGADFAALQYLCSIAKFESIHPPWKANNLGDQGIINVWLGAQTSQTPTPVTTNERVMRCWDGQNGNALWTKTPVSPSWFYRNLLIIGNYLFCNDPDDSTRYCKFNLVLGTADPAGPNYNRCALNNINKARVPTVAGKHFVEYNAGITGSRRKQAT